MALMRRRAPVAPEPAMVGATAVVPLDPGSSWKTWKFGNRDWQTEGWRLYDIVPEHRYLANWIGDSVSQARLYVAEVGETGEETGEVEDPALARLAGVPLGTGDARDDNLRLAGVDLAVAGECWMIGEGAAEDPENAEGAWFVVTGAAFKRESDKIKVRRPRNQGGEWLELRDGVDILTRCWRPHPNDVDQADSPTRSAIVPLREIELLTKREFAELDSRLTGAGIWFLPEGVDFPRSPDDPPGLKGFMAYLQRAIAANMMDQGRASSMSPIMASIPDQLLEHLDKFREPTTFWSELSEQITPMKDRAIVRLASSFEVPNENLLGMSTANHWTAWAISEEGIKRIRPYLAVIAAALTRGFLQLALEKMKVPNPERFAYRFDTAPLAVRPNRTEDAIQLHDRLLLSDEELVRAASFDPETMPSDDERVKMAVYRALVQTPSLILDPGVQAVLGLPAIALPGAEPAVSVEPAEEPDEDGPPELEPPDDENTPGPGSSRSLPGQSAPPASLETRLGRRATQALTGRLDARIADLALSPRQFPPPSPQHVFNAASKLMVLRALELAGGRLTTPAERRGRWGEVPRHELHVRVGPVTPDKAEHVLAGAWTHLPAVASDLGVSTDDLARLLHGYVVELLVRGMAHHDDLLYAALSIANRGRGLEPEAVAA